jgi:hypothetical protein
MIFNYVSEQLTYDLVCEYLNINDIKSFGLTNKSLYNNIINKQIRFRNIYFKKYLSPSSIIIRFMRKLYLKLKNIVNYQNIQFQSMFHENNYFNLIDNKTIALYYFKHYNYVKAWLKPSAGWKKDLIDSYNFNIPLNPTRFDLYKILKVMNKNDIFMIGW